MFPKISLVIPLYNAQELLDGCLRSVIRQNYKGEIELIIVNDGSTDESRQILDRFASADYGRFNIKVIHQENQGAAAARTRGLKKASGEYIFILSQDCIADPNWISSVVKILGADQQIGIAQGQILPEQEINTPIFHCTRVFNFSFSFETAAIAYRVSALDKAGRYFDQELSEFGDDTDLAWRILEAGYESHWLDQPTVHHKVLPQKFWIEVKKAWGVQKFPLLVKKHPQLRQYLQLGFVWGGVKKPLRLWQHEVKVPWHQKLLIVIPHLLLRNFISELALLYGSLKYQSLVL